jgi:hypothetical protein
MMGMPARHVPEAKYLSEVARVAGGLAEARQAVVDRGHFPMAERQRFVSAQDFRRQVPQVSLEIIGMGALPQQPGRKEKTSSNYVEERTHLVFRMLVLLW